MSLQTEVYTVLQQNGFHSVEVKPVIEALEHVSISWDEVEASGTKENVIAAIDSAEHGNYDSLHSECADRGLI